MGTSVSQGSPRTSNWKPVLACYANTNIPKERVINEVWRASENEQIPISSIMKTDIIFECYKAVENSPSYDGALKAFTTQLLETKQNSIIAEFAKRSITVAFASDSPIKDWKSCFFAEITTYVVSRDISVFVGDRYPNKSINELIEFKKEIKYKVIQTVSSNNNPINSIKDWKKFVDDSITRLKSIK